ncbi:MAG: zinc ABC transporter substrate-binding protein [Truepera sp.]|nr:zinc ABC transporter substrate-binding protein [Truepera sp.]
MAKSISLPLIVVALLALVLSAPAQASHQPPLNVVTTTGIVADLVREVGGDCVSVTALMGPGVDPHLYRASAGDVQLLDEAELIVYNGWFLEGAMDSLLKRLAERRPTLAVAETVAPELLLPVAEEGFQYDPHLWLAPALWQQTIPGLVNALTELRPICAPEFDANAARHQAELLALHDWAQATLASIPPERRILVTAHDAYNYFAAAFGFEASEATQGISTEAEASIADIRAVAELVVSRQIPAIFVETAVNRRNIEAVQAAARDRGWEVTIGATLFADAMGDPGTPEGSYLGMIRHNVLAITAALGGSPAPWPDQLRAWAERWGLQ